MLVVYSTLTCIRKLYDIHIVYNIVDAILDSLASLNKDDINVVQLHGTICR